MSRQAGQNRLRGIMKRTEQAFDFDQWKDLAADPEAFESRRSEVIEDCIARAAPEHRHRLRQLQFRIDMERRRSRTPMQSCLRLYAMMWERVAGEGGLQQAITALQRGLSRPLPAGPRARVLQFPGRD